MLWIITGLLVSYFLGSIPCAYVFGRILKGIDIRKFGSGNVGATNAMRVLGKGAGITVLLFDVLKGFVAVTLIGNLIFARSGLIAEDTLRLILGLSCISGHNWSIFLQFKGGKGVATTLGVLLGLALQISGLKIVLGVVVLSWFIIFFLTRIISAASVTAAVVFPVFIFIFRSRFNQFPTFMFLGTIFSIFIILRHRSNLIRILQGTEQKLTLKKR